MKRIVGQVLAVLAILAAFMPFASTTSQASESRKLFVTSAVEQRELDQVTLPVFEGRRGSEVVWYVVLDSSDRRDARGRGVNYAPKLANARGTAAIQKVNLVNGLVVFPASVDFGPEHVVVGGPSGFPPAAAQPGSIGEAGYSPLIELPNGIILNAPQIANSTGLHDKLISWSADRRSGVFQETEGFYDGRKVYYVSFDASDTGVAALEASTYAPALNAAPGLGSNDVKTSARSGIAPFANGQTGVNNPNRQGLSSALLGEGSPMNVVQSSPHNQKYSPLWDAHLTFWSDTAVATQRNTLQDDFDKIIDLAEEGVVTGPGGAAWGAIGVVINCPIISQE
ncbi:MAG: hypothetical protein Fur005_31150 [Roseiflexaceae bacterium]